MSQSKEKLNEIEQLLTLASTGLYLANTASDIIDNLGDRKFMMDEWFKLLTSMEILKKVVDELQSGELMNRSNN